MTPQRIVTLLPSATEICFALGLGDRIVGVSHECDFPAEAAGRPVLTEPKVDPTGTSAQIDAQVRELVANALSVYRLDEERLRELQPDLIVTQDTCEVCAVSLQEVREATCRLVDADVDVVSLSPLQLSDVLQDIVRVGRAAGVEARARACAAELAERLDRLQAETDGLPRPRVMVLEWLDPPMVAGHWTPEIIRRAGGEPILGHDGAPTGAVEWARIVDAQPDVLLIIPCGFKVAQSLAEFNQLRRQPGFDDLPAVRAGRVNILDGNAFFNRPGPRLVESAELAAVAIHPDTFASRFAVPADALLTWPDILARAAG